MRVQNKLQIKRISKILVGCLAIWFISCVPVGYDTQPTREALIRFPYTGGESGGNTILGFAALDAGFIMADQTASFTYSSFYPINTLAALNGGSGYLLEDLTFSSQLDIVSSGSLIGSPNAINFMPRPGTLQLSNGGKLFSLVNTVVPPNATAVSSVDWYGDTYLAESSTITLPNNLINIYQRTNNTLSLVAFTSSSLLNGINQVAWLPASFSGTYYLAVGGKAGVGALPLTFSPPNSVTFSGSSVNPGINVYGIAFCPVSPYDLAMLFANNTFQTYAFDTSAGQFGSVISSVSTAAILPASSYRAVSWTSDGKYVAVGGANGSSVGRAIVFNYSTRSLVQGATLDIVGTTTVDTVCWSPDNTMLAVGTKGSTQNLRIYSFDGASLTEITSYEVGEANEVFHVDWVGNFLAIYRVATTQKIKIFYVDTVYQRLLLNYEYSLGGSAVSTNSFLSLSRGTVPAQYLATLDPTLNLDLFNGATVPFVFNGVNINTYNPVLLNNSLIFQGANTINLNGNVLDLNLSNTITIASGSSLTIENAIINNVTGTNIVCSDNSAALTLSNCKLVLSGNTQFNAGSLDIYGNVVLTGQYIFTYGSAQKCTIHANAQLFFDAGMTFSYSSSSSDRISLENQFSTLYFYQTLLNINSALQLFNGTLSLEGQCPVNAPSGLFLGDGISANNNIRINVLPESGMYVIGGTVYSQNI
jgi:WD40 repeat protein